MLVTGPEWLLSPPRPLQFQDLTWTCWDRLEVPAGQPERTLGSLLAHLQVCPLPVPPSAWPSPAQLTLTSF